MSMYFRVVLSAHDHCG